ncbi:hypothetical protein KBC59_02975 [Patescibacteria group bacterium]|jgi:hypothetical protein|nr:hypothetical protein [Patescibacteria group bacterium]
MRWEEWRFSARLAWQDRFVRGTSISSAAIVVAMSTFLLVRLIPEGLRTGVLSLHYTIYLGIDDVGPWPWILLVPGGMLTLLIADAVAVYGLFRKDALAARALAGLALVTSIVWAVTSFFLIAVNA